MLISLLYCKLWNEFALQVWNLRREATNCVCSPGDDDAEELEDGEWIPEEDFDPQAENFDEGVFSFCSCHLVLSCTVSAFLVIVIDIRS